ncbi:MAG: flagellar biosynthesis protein FliQ [Fuerstiella sp.]|nr:flagellar biosynthesis protein FliQ [Fuerstiella sp.]
MPVYKANRFLRIFLVLSATIGLAFSAPPTKQQLQRLLKQFPQADVNNDGRLTTSEADAFRKTFQARRVPAQRGAPREFSIDKGWEADSFPEHSVSRKSPAQIREIYARQVGRENAVVSFEEQENGTLRIVGTGHSFMAPGFKTFPLICKASGFTQPLYTHTGGGITGSTRYKWEQENGIFQFEGKPQPKLLSSIANAKWDAMMWGPYFQDRPEFYSCWIDFCLKYNPHMKFYLSDAWPQLYQLEEVPKSEDFFTEAITVAGSLALPALMLGLVVGLLVSIFQAVTQINEQTLALIPKIIAIVVALMVFGSWMLTTLVDYTVKVFTMLPTVASGG